MSDVYLWDTYEKVGREALERRDFGQAIESFRSAVTVAEKLPGEDLRLVMSLRHLSKATAKGGQLSMAHELLSKTAEIAVSRLGSSHSETVQVKRELYEMARELGHLDLAESHLVDVLAAVREHGETEEFLEVLELLAQLSGERERPDNAAILYQQIVEARTELYGEQHPSVAQALLWHSTALSRSGQGEAAEAPLTRAFTMLERQFAEDPKSLAQSLLAGAELMTNSGRPEAALEHQKRALDLLSSVVEDGHQSLWDAREMIASTMATLGRLDEAVEILEYCLQHRKGRDHRTAGILKNLAGLYLTTQRLERAEELYQQATELLKQTLGPDHPAYLASLEERIQLYHFTGRSQQALDLALTTIRSTEERYGPGHPNTAQVYASTAVLAHASRRWDTAYELMKAAEAIWDSLTPRPDDVLANCRINLATCLIELGRKAEAALALNRVTPVPGSPMERVVADLWARVEAPPETPSVEPAPETGNAPEVEANGPAREEQHPHAEANEPSPFDDLEFTEVHDELFNERLGLEPSSSLVSAQETLTSEPPGDDDSQNDISQPPNLEGDVEFDFARDTLAEVSPFDEPEIAPPDSPDDTSGQTRIDEPFAETASDLLSQPELDGLPERDSSPGEEPSLDPLDAFTAMPTDDALDDGDDRQSWTPTSASAEPPSTQAVEEAGSTLEPTWPSPQEDQPEELTDQEGQPLDEDGLPELFPDLPSSEIAAYNGEDSDGDDRRLHQRFNLGLNRFFELALKNGKGELMVVRSFLVDLSAGGLRVNSEKPLPKDETFQLTLPAEWLGEDVELPARVTWQRALFGASYIQGLEFLEVTPDQAARIESVLSRGDLHEGGRQHFRLYRPFPIQISHQDHAEWLTSYASDLSVEGLGTRLSTELGAGSTVRIRLGLEFELPTVEVGATVAWSRSADNGISLGLRFEEVGPVEARTIKLYIDRCLELSPD